MSEIPSTRPAALPTFEDGLGIVLFGRPAAGKSALLGALAQAAIAQEHLLGGHLRDTTQGLSELQRRLYEETSQQTAEELVSYPILYESFEEDSQSPLKAVLLDCNGRVANDLLSRRGSLEGGTQPGTLARALSRGQALILTLDASTPDRQLESDLAELVQFLKRFERRRGDYAEVGGLPVFLALTKCDLLTCPEEPQADWLKRVEERRLAIQERLTEFMGRGEESPFGRIDVQVIATAVKRPPSREAAQTSREPLGVADLFRRGLQAAQEYQTRRRGAGRRLVTVLLGSVALVAGLATYTGYLGVYNQQIVVPSDLQNRAEIVRSSEKPTPSARLEGNRERLARRIAELADLRHDPTFDDLPEELRGWIDSRLDEFRSYDEFFKRLQEMRPPVAARSLMELETLEKALRSTSILPRPEWAETRAARLVRERLEDVKELRAAARRAEDWYVGLRGRGAALWTFDRRKGDRQGVSLDWPAWQEDVRRYSTELATPPFGEGDRVREPDGPTYGDTVLRFPAISEARNECQRIRQRLERLVDLAAALGVAPLADRPAVFQVPAQATPTLNETRGRWEQMKRAYPRFEQDFRVSGLPEAALGDIRQAARASYTRFLEPARERVLEQLRAEGVNRVETALHWQGVGRWLESQPEDLAGWRILARVLRRLHEGEDTEIDPVNELAAFLNKSRFDIRLGRVTLELPKDLELTPQGPLEILSEDAGKSRTWTLALDEKATAAPQLRFAATSYLPPEDPELTYYPGGGLWARLTVRKKGDTAPWYLSWVRSRSSTYAYEHLLRGAFLHAEKQPITEGTYYEELRLRFGSDSRIPMVPDLLPIVRLK